MVTLLVRGSASLSRALPTVASRTFRRHVQTLEKSPHVFVFPNPSGPPKSHILSLLHTQPPKPSLALGTTLRLPPEPETFTENHHFIELLQAVVAENATSDPDVKTQAAAYASTGGSNLGSGGTMFAGQSRKRARGGQHGGGGGAGQGGAGGASAQGGMGGGGVGGWVHVADQRNPPDWGRIAWPEDMLGSLEVDGKGEFVGSKGQYQRSGTYRICTREGVLHLTPYLRQKLVESLQELEKNMP